MSMEAIINTLNLILLIFVILVFWRLKSVLGSHDEFTQKGSPPQKTQANPLEASARPDLRVVSNRDEDEHDAALAAISKIDRNFELPEFLNGAGKAYEIILSAYAGHERSRLQELVSEEVYQGFAAAIDDREAQGYRLETQIVSAAPPEVHEIDLDGTVARITIIIKAELCSVVRNIDDAVVEGSPEEIIKTTDYWTFERQLKSRSPIWTLVATESR